jgi:phosphoglycolate phosphatase
VSARPRSEVVLFDLDGVLADSRGPIARHMNAALSARGFAPVPEERLHPYIGPSLSFGFSDLLGLDPGDPEIAELIHAYRAGYAENGLRETRAFAGIADALAVVGERRRLGVATSKPRPYAEPLIEMLGLRGFFEAIFAPDLDIHVQSKTETVAAAVRAFGSSAPATMVGDRHVDMEAARVHGLRAVGVTWGIGSESELREAGADVLVASPAELAAAV